MWGLSLSGIGFLYEGVRVLARGIGPIVPHIMAVADPGGGAIDSGGVWGLRGCLGRGGLGFRVAELGSSFLFFLA